MAFSITWNESYPAGTDLGSGIDTYIQQDKVATRERLESLLGISNFTSRDPISADALKMSGTADSYIIGGTASWGVKNNASTDYNLQVTDAGVLTIRAGLTVTSGDTSTNKLTVGGQGIVLEHDAGNSGTSLTIDWNNSNNQLVTLTGGCTFTFSNPVAGAWYQLRLKQDATGSRTVTWPANVKWAGGIAVTLTTTAARTDMVAFYYNGTNYLGMLINLNWNG